MPIEQQQLFTGSLSLNYAVTGRSDAPPIILLHGVTHRWQAFDEIIPSLTGGYRVYAVDLRGHGESGRVRDGYRAVSYAEDILALIRDVTGSPVVVGGHSLGALAALQVGAELGDQCRSLVLMEPPLVHARQSIKDTPWYEMFDRTYQLVSTASGRQEIEDVLKARLPDAPLDVLRGMADRLNHLDPQVLATLLDPSFMRSYDLVGLLERVTCPTLLMQSDPGVNSVLEEVDVTLVNRHIRDCRHVIIRDAIHTLHFSHPHQVSAVIVEFLEEA